MLEAWHRAKFSTLDLKVGYWQILIREEDKQKTAFRKSSAAASTIVKRLPLGFTTHPPQLHY